MKTQISAVFLLLLVMLGGCYSDDTISGSGPIVLENRSLTSFTEITSSIPGKVILTQGNDQEVRVETHSDVINFIETYVVNERLVIETQNGINLRNIDRLRIYITVPDYQAITITGAGSFELAPGQCLDVATLRARITGAGRIDVCGNVDDLTVEITGAGSFNGFDLTSQNTDARITGAGNIRTHSQETLNITISGAGSVYYRGQPDIHSNISGVGRVVNSN